jgi:D-serine deaminase-like pyridoxal phosphate-dependent protein
MAHTIGGSDRRVVTSSSLKARTKNDLPTPSLLLDMDVFEANLKRMASHARAAGINLRPHAKSHKCAEIALRQLEAGAIGICATTITEAERLAAAGISGILITSEMVGKGRIERLVRLSREHPTTMSVVDNAAHAAVLSEAAVAARTRLNVLIDLDLGLRRTGVAGVDDGIELAENVMDLPNLKLRGVHAYSSMSAHVVGFEERREHSHNAMKPAIELYSALQERQMGVEILTGGSTGTYNIDTEFEGVTELQTGSYVFMDVDYYKIGGRHGKVFDDFGFSLTVLATIVSKSYENFATVDAGFKAFATDRPFGPELKYNPGSVYHFGGDEHGILELKEAYRDFRLGDRLEFIVPHCDPTVNLYDRIYCCRGDEIVDVWSILRGYD